MSTAANVESTGEDSDDSSLSTSSGDKTDLLEQFREKWQQELKHDDVVTDECPVESGADQIALQLHNADFIREQSDEDRAKQLFIQGTELEKLGKVFDAMCLYRRAVQIVPDIEFRMYETTKLQQQKQEKINELLRKEKQQKLADRLNRNDQDENLEDVDLMYRFQLAIQKSGGAMFQRATNVDGTVLSTGSSAHISDLPLEIILYILRWVVSSDLDLRSLEQCSLVSRGFYICAKDQDIWKIACQNIWGEDVGSLTQSAFTSWRQMYLERHRVHFNGCYISKTSYLRCGENSFQDQFYRPVQFVEYYRYFRFFPDGKALMMTTADEPAITVAKLKYKNTIRSDIQVGNYSLHDDMLVIVFKRNRQHCNQPASQRMNRRGSVVTHTEESGLHQFYMEFTIISSTKRRFGTLQWKHYSHVVEIKSNQHLSSNFELTRAQYPALQFSRVKSYSSASENPLQ